MDKIDPIEIEPVKNAFESLSDWDWDWNKPSLAGCAMSDSRSGIVLWGAGGDILEEIANVSAKLDDLGLDDCPEGIWIWEGKCVGQCYPSTPDHAEEWDSYPKGIFREPTEEEWTAICYNECPWNIENWKIKKE